MDRDIVSATMETTILHVADNARRVINGSLADTRAHLGQFMTPTPVAELMASMISTRRSTVRLLDPGAGVGSLTAAAVDQLLSSSKPPRLIHVTCFEIDPRLCEHLASTLAECRRRCEAAGVQFQSDLRVGDYIAAQLEESGMFVERHALFDLVIMNPPYRKIKSNSLDRHRLRELGIETSNLYSAFMLLAIRQLAEKGAFISISPRSFCNGPYFRRFRLELLKLLDLRRIHVFESRTEAFKDDAVLQENVILYGRRRSGQSPKLRISSTVLASQIQCRQVSADAVLRPGDGDAVIHLPANDRADEISKRLSKLPDSLATLGLTVSTGRVVGFRAREHLRQNPSHETGPLIYPLHLNDGNVVWPIQLSRKPNAIAINSQTDRLLVPSGFYVLIRRFSTKEERRRIVAAMYDPRTISAERIGFDNKNNYIHLSGRGLDIHIARGMTIYLNSTVLDEYFRIFSGHTQVNASDMRRLPFPSQDRLVTLSQSCDTLAKQDEVDTAVEQIL